MKVLVAEDDPVSRRLLEALLSKWGYEVEVACDGEQSWAILQREDAPNLAILDWMMPGRDGVALCRDVRKLARDTYTYLLLLTARSRKQDIIEGLDAGADDYVTKPFDPNELHVRLRAGARIVDLQRQLLSVRESLREQATHDSLTGLPNRLLFGDRLTHSLAFARRHNRHLAVIFLDLDRFKIINDTLGHDIGDLLLKAIAERLSSGLREADTIARMGGDEFTMLLTDIRGAEDAVKVARKCLTALSKPIFLDGHELFITASIGISLCPSDGSDVETLVKNADTAMYRAKEQGRNNIQLYTSALHAKAFERIALLGALHKALDQEQFVVFYQPQVTIETGAIVGAEALVRWEHPEFGLLLPDEFIPLAEETGLIVPISEWVLRKACAQNKAWQDVGLQPVDIAVNISAHQLQQGALVGTIERVLAETGCAPRHLDLELTESALMHSPESAASVLGRLKAMGVQISIDDFGTGHSSLSYLKCFPVDAVKIDRSFIKEITADGGDAAIARAIVAMAHGLNLKVIAEGVETLAQLEILRTLGCDEMQGYLVSRPVPAEEFVGVLQASRPLAEGELRLAA